MKTQRVGGERYTQFTVKSGGNKKLKEPNAEKVQQKFKPRDKQKCNQVENIKTHRTNTTQTCS